MDLRQKLLKASLAHVELCGFKQEAICRGAQLLNLSCASHAILPQGAYSLVEHVLETAHAEFLAKLKTGMECEKPSFEESTRAAATAYIAQILPYSTRWAEALAVMVQPANALLGLGLLNGFTSHAAKVVYSSENMVL